MSELVESPREDSLPTDTADEADAEPQDPPQETQEDAPSGKAAREDSLPTDTADEPDAEPQDPPQETQEDAPSGKAAREEAEEATGAEEPSGAEEAGDGVAVLHRAREQGTPVQGKVIGWNNGGFHVVINGVTAFCPRSEMELGRPSSPDHYLDNELEFIVLRIRDGGRRVVVSRARVLKEQRQGVLSEIREQVRSGAVLEGKVASLTDFGAFVDLGGVKGLVHVSELSREHVEHPGDVLSVGDEVKVKVLKVEKGGERISLSMRALEPDPWKGIRERYPEGSLVSGTVEKTERFGAFIQLEPGLTGLMPSSTVSLPRDTSLARAFPPGRKVDVQVMRVDPRRRRISLAPKGSGAAGSQADFEAYKKDRGKDEGTGGGFNALADAFRKLDSVQ